MKKKQKICSILSFVIIGLVLSYINFYYSETPNIYKCLLFGYIGANPMLFLPKIINKYRESK